MIFTAHIGESYYKGLYIPSPSQFGRDQIIMVMSKSIWSDQNHFGPTKTVGKKGKKFGQTRAVAIGFYQIHHEFLVAYNR